MKLPFIKQILSYFYPQLIKRDFDIFNQEHKLELYQNQLILSTTSAVYSFGIKYYPFAIPFKKIKHDLTRVESFLMLGTALGSGLKILQQKYSVFPCSTLVDINPLLLDYSKKFMNLNSQNNVNWQCIDAETFLDQNEDKFDLIGIDIFINMNVPLFVKSTQFMSCIKHHLSKKGKSIWNLTYSSRNEKLIVEDRLQKTFNQVIQIPHDTNNFYICYE